MALTEDGRVIDKSGKEYTDLTDYQLDLLISELYPELPTTRDWSRHATSHHGSYSFQYGQEWNQTWIESKVNQNTDVSIIAQDIDTNCEVAQKVYALGGTRLLTLYCNKFNFFSAATDLDMTYAALMKWFQRFRAAKLKEGLTPEDLGIV